MFTGELCDSPLFIERDTLGIFCVGCRKFIFRDNIFDDLKTLKGLAESTLNWYVTPNMKKQHMLVCMQEKINLKRRAVDAWKYVNEQKCPTPEISTDVENPEVQSLDGNDRFYTSQPNFHLEDLPTEYMPKGLKNLGNTCFLNCIVQAFCSLPSLLKIFISKTYRMEKSHDIHFESLITMKLHELLNQIRYRENGTSIHSPDEFLNLIRFFDNFQVPDVQHDAHEFLCKMIESLNSSKVAHINNGGIEWKESNDFKHIFGTTLEQCISCERCKKKHVMQEWVQTLTVTISDVDRQLASQRKHHERPYGLRRRQQISGEKKEENITLEEKIQKKLPLGELLDNFFKKESLDIMCDCYFNVSKILSHSYLY